MQKYFVVVNCDQIIPGRTLGVAHFTFALLQALRRTGRVRILCKITRDMRSCFRQSELASSACDALVLSRASKMPRSSLWPIRPQQREKVVEYSPHHFQPYVSSAPKVLTCFDLHVYDIPWKYSNGQHLKTVFRRKIRDADRILTPFPRTALAVAKYFDDAGGRTCVTESPLMLNATRPDDDAILRAADRFGIDGSVPLILYPAQLQQHKNHWNLFTALAVARERGLNARLICPGSEFSRGHSAVLHGRIAQLSLNDRVSLPGFVSEEELRCLYALSDAVICPSLAEGGAYVCLEAIAFRRPVACAAIESARLHLDSVGAEVPLFDPYSADDIAQALLRIIEDGPSCTGKNEIANRLVTSWSFDEVAREYLSQLEVL
jgi:glycosyltransferase involved in cell wall biosynthesis